MSVRSDVTDYTAGKISADALAKKWKGRSWKPAHPRRRSIVDLYLDSEDVATTTGSWDEVKVMWITGQMTDSQYFALSEAVDKAAGKPKGPNTATISRKK